MSCTYLYRSVEKADSDKLQRFTQDNSKWLDKKVCESYARVCE